MALPTTPELIEHIKSALDKAHNDWEGAMPRSASAGTRALKRRVWEMGFDYEGVYPTAHGLGADAEDIAAERLLARRASFWGVGTEHSTLREFQYDVAWVEYDAEFDDREVPQFKRLVLALETEFGGEREVLLDFHKLLCARAELRVMVWWQYNFPDGYDALAPRLREARNWAEGHWLLSAWDDDDGFTHRAYRGSTRLS